MNELRKTSKISFQIDANSTHHTLFIVRWLKEYQLPVLVFQQKLLLMNFPFIQLFNFPRGTSY